MISDDSPVIACSNGSSMTLQNLNFLLRNAFKTFSRKAVNIIVYIHMY
ncbi:MAG: hypothetical protein QXP91_06640 [Candidatus Methanomethylicia archaeon]